MHEDEARTTKVPAAEGMEQRSLTTDVAIVLAPTLPVVAKWALDQIGHEAPKEPPASESPSDAHG